MIYMVVVMNNFSVIIKILTNQATGKRHDYKTKTDNKSVLQEKYEQVNEVSDLGKVMIKIKSQIYDSLA